MFLTAQEKWKANNPEKIKAQRDRFKEAHPLYKKEYYEQHKEAVQTYMRNAYYKYKKSILSKDLARKIQVMTHYSGGAPTCAHCQEQDIQVLSIDHIQGCTKNQRKEQGSGKTFYKWLAKKGFPAGYQVLCFNCNIKKYAKENWYVLS